MKKRKKSKAEKKERKNLTRQIKEIFYNSPKKQFNHKQIAKALDIHDKGKIKTINKILKNEAEKGVLTEVKKGDFKLFNQKGSIEGKIDITKRGAAYLISEETEQDIFIAPKNMNHALHGDLVKVFLFAKFKRKKPEGEVVEILERNKTSFVGSLEVSNKFAFLVPDSNKMHVDIYIPLEELNGAKNGQKAIAEITDWPKKATSPFGSITKVLGDPGENEVEMNSILIEFGLPTEFPPKVEDAAEKIPENIPEEEIEKRRDMRDVKTFTIDPAEAKDFDDALSYRRIDKNTLEVGIHIADVSHYVKPNDIIDETAEKRATSVYLVDRVVPMLPEKLSNGICSLNPEEPRLSFSAVFKLNENGEILDKWFGKTVILSDKRFTYKEAQKSIDEGEGEFSEELRTLNNLAKKMRKRRVAKGSLEIMTDEVEFELDDMGKPLGITEKQVLDTNLMIEDFMLLANSQVAKFINEKEKSQAFIYRIHDKPDEEKLQQLRTFLAKFGYKLEIRKNEQASAAINRLLKRVRGKHEENVISQMAIRSMAKAIYTTDNIGHYGLAFEHYTHFTSPIRRYPDLIVHRLLENYLQNGETDNPNKLESICKHSSSMERKAIDAERESIKYKQVEFLQNQVGNIFTGMVSGITDWGIFVELVENKCEGLIRLRNIEDDLYYLDEKNYRIIGNQTGREFNLGDTLQVRITKADLEKKQLDMDLVDS